MDNQQNTKDPIENSNEMTGDEAAFLHTKDQINNSKNMNSKEAAFLQNEALRHQTQKVFSQQQSIKPTFLRQMEIGGEHDTPLSPTNILLATSWPMTTKQSHQNH